jgi:hypothetical protein
MNRTKLSIDELNSILSCAFYKQVDIEDAPSRIVYNAYTNKVLFSFIFLYLFQSWTKLKVISMITYLTIPSCSSLNICSLLDFAKLQWNEKKTNLHNLCINKAVFLKLVVMDTFQDFHLVAKNE